jgi:alpha-L-rhamnosidase
MNSFNHYAYGAIGQWLYERVASLTPNPAQPGYQHFFIRPLIGLQLESARAGLETPYGLASSSWKKENGKLWLDVIVPPTPRPRLSFRATANQKPLRRAHNTLSWISTHRTETPDYLPLQHTTFIPAK